MKKIIYLSLLGIMLLGENKTWLGIMDMYIDNKGRNISNSEIAEIENVNVKFRICELFKNIEDLFNNKNN